MAGWGYNGLKVAAAKGAATFFQGAKYSPKVLRQMSKADDIYHAFPNSVDGLPLGLVSGQRKSEQMEKPING